MDILKKRWQEVDKKLTTFYNKNKLLNKEMLNEDKIPEDKYLVLGDNRPISKDSRIIGLIDKKDIKGYTSIVVYPFTKIKNAK